MSLFCLFFFFFLFGSCGALFQMTTKTEIVDCIFLVTLFHYFSTTNFFWMLVEGELIESFAIRTRRFSLIFIAISIRRDCLILLHVHFGLNFGILCSCRSNQHFFFIKTLVTLRTRNFWIQLYITISKFLQFFPPSFFCILDFFFDK